MNDVAYRPKISGAPELHVGLPGEECIRANSGGGVAGFSSSSPHPAVNISARVIWHDTEPSCLY